MHARTIHRQVPATQPSATQPWRLTLAQALSRQIIRLALLRLPVLRGGVRIAQSPFCRRLTAQPKTLVTSLWRGPKILVQLPDYDARSIYFWGANDRKIISLIRRLLHPGDTMLDIGANFGPVGLVAAARVGPAGAVHCFEPQPGLAECIRQSAALNALQNLTVHPLALSSHTGTGHLLVPEGHTGCASLSLSHPHAHASTAPGAATASATPISISLSVPIYHAGDYLRCLGLPAIALIKLDVESHEETLLNAAKDFLIECPPKALVFESHDHPKPFFTRGPVKILQRLGYEFFQIRQRPLFRLQLKNLTSNLHLETGYDFVAFKRDRVLSELASVCSII